MKTDQEVKSEEIDNSLVHINSVEKVQLDLDIPAINAVCSNYFVWEDQTHLEIIMITFTKTWYEINLGERIMTDYIKFCQTKIEFDHEYFKITGRQIR